MSGKKKKKHGQNQLLHRFCRFDESLCPSSFYTIIKLLRDAGTGYELIHLITCSCTCQGLYFVIGSKSPIIAALRISRRRHPVAPLPRASEGAAKSQTQRERRG